MSSGPLRIPGGNDVAADDMGLVSWNMDPATAGNQTILPTSGTVYLMRFELFQAAVLAATGFVITVAGATLTAGQCFSGLYDATGARLATSADASAAFAGTGFVAPAYTATVAAKAGYYYGTILVNGTTMPTLLAGAGLLAGGVSIGNANMSAASARFLVGPAGQTSLPASIALAGCSMAAPATWWMGVK